MAAALVMLVVMVGVTLGELLNDIAGGRLPPGLLGELLWLSLPDVATRILPLAVFVGMLWGLGRLYRDQEMAVMRSSGFSLAWMVRPLLNLLLPASALLLVIGLYLAPLAATKSQERLELAFRTASEWGLQTGEFHVLQDGNLVLYVEAVERDGQTLRNVFIQQRDGEREQIWLAERGYYWLNPDSGERYLTLENGQITEGGRGQLDFGIVRFARNDLRLPEPEPRDRSQSVEARPTAGLLTSSLAEEQAELQWRISPAIAVVVLGLLAIPLAHQRPREGRGGRVLLGVLTYVIYANILYLARGWVAEGRLSVTLGLWWVHAVFLGAALWWLMRQGRRVGAS